uniref:Uncharacterized protein n=1 Tax=Fagus sylvatica TaxID=28930 RepID=A0A2N9FFM2_FAGSY
MEELQLEAEPREPAPPPLPVAADLETHLGSDTTNLASLSPRHDLEPHAVACGVRVVVGFWVRWLAVLGCCGFLGAVARRLVAGFLGGS